MKTYVKILLCVFILAVSAAAGFFVWKIWFSHDEKAVVTKDIQELAAAFNKTTPEGFAVELERASKIASYFTEMCRIDLPQYQVAMMRREDLAKMVLSARKNMTSLSVSVYEIQPFLDESAGRGKVFFTGMVLMKRSGGTQREVRDFAVDIEKSEGKWLISRIAFQNVIQK